MSHFSQMKTKIRDRSALSEVAASRGWTCAHHENYVDRFNNSLKDCEVLTDSAGNIKMLVSRDGTVVHDAWYMGHDYEKFMQDYSAQVIRNTAMNEGGTVTGCEYNHNGDLVLVVEY